ncbi:putative lipoprotein [Streptococcus pneumoniae GA11856]|nr:putative lipoprotein [Streptococcus pneumoniae GA11856]
MKKIVKYSSLAALGLVAAGVLAACSGGAKKEGEAASKKKSSLQPMDHQGHLSMKKMAN